jgi:hypothetical protein
MIPLLAMGSTDPSDLAPLTLDARALRIAMAAAGLRSVSALGRKAKLSESYIRQIVGGYIPSPDVRERIAKVLHVAVSDVWPPLQRVADEGQAG